MNKNYGKRVKALFDAVDNAPKSVGIMVTKYKGSLHVFVNVIVDGETQARSQDFSVNPKGIADALEFTRRSIKELEALHVPEPRLTDEAKAAYDDFSREYGRTGNCSCHLGGAPCGSCTHDGNPHHLVEDETAWVDGVVGEL